MRENIVRENYQRNSIKVLYIGGKLNPSDMENKFFSNYFIFISFFVTYVPNYHPVLRTIYIRNTYILSITYPYSIMYHNLPMTTV